MHSHVTISPYNINGILKLLTHVGGIRFYHVAMLSKKLTPYMKLKMKIWTVILVDIPSGLNTISVLA